MATYKAEFLSHYYEGAAPPAARLRDGPRSTGGRASPRWLPGSANFVTQTPGTRARSPSSAAGMPSTARDPSVRRRDVPARGCGATPGAARRGLPRGRPLARHLQQPLPPRDRAGRRRGAGGRGFQVVVPAARSAAAGRSTTTACSTRPRAARARSSTRLRAGDRGGTPVVGLEPSCVAVFRDELMQPLPERRGREAARASRPSSSSEFLDKHAPHFAPPQLEAEGARARPLPPQGDRRASTPRRACSRSWARLRGARLGLLRHGRLVRLREGPLRRLDAVGERCSCPRCARPTPRR